MRPGFCMAALLIWAASGAGAEAPATSIRPVANPVYVVAADPLPMPLTTGETALAPSVSPRPLARTTVELAAAPTDPTPEPSSAKKKDKPSKKGSVCGDPSIKGEVLAPIKAKIKGCGIENPVRVTAIDGIRLNQPATISCDTATATKRWINKALRPAMGKREVIEIRIAASYACRPRNNKKGAKISEHGRGRAIDVAGFVFADGSEWSILRDYNKQVRRAHKDACGIFGTTLGPGSDGFHEDHLHFDIAQHKGGAYCR